MNIRDYVAEIRKLAESFGASKGGADPALEPLLAVVREKYWSNREEWAYKTRDWGYLPPGALAGALCFAARPIDSFVSTTQGWPLHGVLRSMLSKDFIGDPDKEACKTWLEFLRQLAVQKVTP